ncbi:Arginine rich protein [Penicillium digitatum]|uniref:Arginine rich protein n=3 Tax=Penicillium digitatum TaxID=36651 RepID=K9FHG0_PEND2|nr:Arginine rich protein [Penicillium digitatum Pd1]EKV06777.1 Arginine rich protein [Penicillium digitatum Pd1]EKV08890.1 Arginine rich protein [Penicillium digitatum PHI26]QQK40913.1 Arginine rich protein [Penicillium digitatum]
MASNEAMEISKRCEDVSPMAKQPVDIESVKRKKFKTDDLPLSAAQHAVIDKLLHSFKKKGGFDSVRKQIWAEFNDGELRTDFTNKLVALAESEIDREPALLSRERGKAATLIEGAVDRGDVYKSVEDSIDQLASKHLDFILESVREIRCQDVGEEVAARELELGNKTDADYEAHVRAQREQREKIWREEERKLKEIEEEEKRVRDEERKKKRELERQKDEEDRARRKEIDEQRRADRERQREEQRILDEQRERERDERYERRRREDRDRYRGWDRDRDRSRTRDRDRFRDRSPAYRSDRGLSPWPRDSKHDKSSTSNAPTPVLAPLVDEKSLEEAALQMLLREGEELAAKARQKPEFDFEEAEAIENGLRPPVSTLGPTKGANDSRFSNTSTRAASLSRDADARREAVVARAGGAHPVTTQIVVANGPGMLLRGLEIVISMRAAATATSGMTEAVEATGQTAAAAADPPAGVTGTAVLAGTEIGYGIDRGPKTVTETAAATETEITIIIALGATGPLAHPYADVLAAVHARALVLVTALGHVLDLLDGDLGLGVARLLLL